MAFLAPIWLFALIPWAGLTAWLLWGRRQRALVPFLPLWRGVDVQKRTRRAIDLPPIALAAAIFSILLAILAAGAPVIKHAEKGIPNLTIIVDRGMSMSANDHGEPRYFRAAQAAEVAIREFAPNAKIDLQIIPGPRYENAGADWISIIKSTAPTAVDTAQSLQAQIAAANAPAIVITDQKLDGNVIQFSPGGDISDVGIISFSVRASPAPAAMVAVRNNSGLSSCKLVVKSGEQAVSKIIELPPRGQDRNYFVDLKDAGKTAEAAIEVSDDLSLDDRAWLVRQQAWPVVEARSDVAPAIQRMIEVFSQRRPATQDAIHVAIVRGTDLASDPSAIIPDENAARNSITLEPLTIASGPLKIQEIDWPAALNSATAAEIPAGDWIPIVTAGQKIIVAIQETPVRKIWVGFDSASFARSADFVIFWNEIFQWLGNGGDVYAASLAGAMEGRWTRQDPQAPTPARDTGQQPGLYRSADGAQRAINPPPMSMPSPLKIDGTKKLSEYQHEKYSASTDLRKGTALTSLIALLIGITLWQKGPGK